jgi:hypothetical protein
MFVCLVLNVNNSNLLLLDALKANELALEKSFVYSFIRRNFRLFLIDICLDLEVEQSLPKNWNC